MSRRSGASARRAGRPDGKLVSAGWRLALGRASVVLALVVLCQPTALAEQLGVPAPPRSRVQASGPDAGLIESGLGFGKTVRFYRKHFQRNGTSVRQVPTYAYRGVTIARFLAERPHTAWLAVHVFRHRGRTYIHVVPRGDRKDARKAVHNTP